ncbi:Membrane bound protein complex subunit mbxG [Marinitoga hydrogenitolerans DSM 16785]|uniref:Membrane bound protein complex subunit mbxG n=1 Tax=Marinitoga hydrogenitolerans (strain DSM 16785 / JCM 12826 / AT1271) TaxID=1122195 RepID=A0A1M4W6J7_MARH1|nr:sodium:proton antiporter [Marinitoga hydrogenitolerans]SHE76904.1 Membrane bound protein complex subunit mbxG [Marinitoga hydrogenitolerans DSM 16785]
MIQYLFIGLILIGIYGLLTQKNLIKIVVALNVLEIGVNLFIISIGYVNDGVAPILFKGVVSNKNIFVDPLPQALVLTAIVIGVGVTALALTVARKLYEKYKTLELDEMGSESND